MRLKNSVNVIDIFCGVGGLTHGLARAGLNVVAGVDSDERCKFAYERNNKNARFIHKKIEDVSSRLLKDQFGTAEWKVLVGCAPCQPFSSYTVKTRKSVKNTGNWNLINHFLQKIRDVRPDIVSMENVPHLVKQEIFDDFQTALEKMQYTVTYKILNCADYGVPQSRRRLVLLASNRKKKIALPPPEKGRKTLRDAISKMPQLQHGTQHANDPMHKSAKLGEINLRRIKASNPGGTWDEWPKELLPDCYKRDTGQTYKNVYGRMKWDLPAPTITGQFYRYGTGRFGHPTQDRALSLREGALIQSFPDDYQFTTPDSKIYMRAIGTHIGNAVPVRLGEHIGKAILNYIQDAQNNER